MMELQNSVSQNPDDLARQIQCQHRLAKAHESKSLSCALKAGALLATAKALVPHGEWTDYLKRSCKVSPRSAQRYMSLHSKLPHCAKTTRVADLSIRRASKLLARQSSRARKASPATPIAQPGLNAQDVTIKFRREDLNLALDVWEAGYRALARIVHPDVGGDTALMQALTSLHAAIQNQLKAAMPRDAAAA